MSDYAETGEFKEWAEEVRTGLIPRMESSSIVVSLVPKGDTDIKYAVELGVSIMMDKPIVAVIQPGTRVPAKLVKVADLLLECDMDSKESMASMMERINEFARTLPENEEA